MPFFLKIKNRQKTRLDDGRLSKEKKSIKIVTQKKDDASDFDQSHKPPLSCTVKDSHSSLSKKRQSSITLPEKLKQLK